MFRRFRSKKGRQMGWTDEEKQLLIDAYENKKFIKDIPLLKDKSNTQLAQMARNLGLNEKYLDFDYMVGKTFGRLTILKRIGQKNKKILYECSCSCGNPKLTITDGQHLRCGGVKSCGCLKEELPKKRIIDLTGKHFGNLTVLGRDENDYVSPQGKHQLKWKCKCDCGNVVSVTGNELKRGHVKSCGCGITRLALREKAKKNQYDLSGEYGIGYDSNGREFYFDLEDYDLIKDYLWSTDNYGYIRSTGGGGEARIMMHVLIMGTKDKPIYVDHIRAERKNDNRKCNLRLATKSQNNMNIGLRSNNTSGVTGISYAKNINRWHAYINKNGKRMNIGYYSDFEEAVAARKEFEEALFGDRSYDNSQVVNL